MDDAANYAVKQIYGENYAIHDTLHIPRQLWEGPHGGELSVGLAHVDELIKQEAANIDPRTIATRTERTADQKKQDYIDDLVNHYKLQTTGDDKGVYVLDPVGGLDRRVYTKGGVICGTCSTIRSSWRRFAPAASPSKPALALAAA